MSALFTIALLPAFLWRRTDPLAAVAGITVLSVAFQTPQAIAGVSDAMVSTFIAITVPYALFRWGTGGARIVGGALLGAGLIVSVVLDGSGVPGAIAGLLFVGGACMFGVIRRQRVDARQGEYDRIRSAEREVLARDLHDTVAHRVSAIVIRAQAARAMPPESGHSPGRRRMTRVLIADDQPAVREGLALLLESQGFDVVGQAADGHDAVAAGDALISPGITARLLATFAGRNAHAPAEPRSPREEDVLRLLARG
ncbi:histidine kinase [Microbacterium amylolyticum]|uniref:Response regulatory domain-containing protein n=1 Tax=Microbacterium amylolyticum TaxID=936337 RepID=A0ABS4ZHW9_9MICO|nr:hypothetical protein [Microbacterium amylolyticum]